MIIDILISEHSQLKIYPKTNSMRYDYVIEVGEYKIFLTKEKLKELKKRLKDVVKLE